MSQWHLASSLCFSRWRISFLGSIFSEIYVFRSPIELIRDFFSHLFSTSHCANVFPDNVCEIVFNKVIKVDDLSDKQCSTLINLKRKQIYFSTERLTNLHTILSTWWWGGEKAARSITTIARHKMSNCSALNYFTLACWINSIQDVLLSWLALSADAFHVIDLVTTWHNLFRLSFNLSLRRITSIDSLNESLISRSHDEANKAPEARSACFLLFPSSELISYNPRLIFLFGYVSLTWNDDQQFE